jgi:spore coat polysaccharide biosynthesis protein SpsF (cytidylyltransferase family)
MSKLGIVIQARMGSSRLPNKMMMPFYKDLSLLDVILETASRFSGNYKVIVATSEKSIDNIIEEKALSHHLSVYRGDESDVLKRFIDAAEFHDLEAVVRVCADNPFISYKYIAFLIDLFNKIDKDYISFKTKIGIPSIKTHYGFFAEIVKLSALKKVSQLTNDVFYHEHVTNYIYSHTDIFDIHLIEMPFKENSSIRLTIDTIDDFKLAQNIYSELIELEQSTEPENIINYLELHPEYLELMNKQIQLQQK